MLFVPVIPPNSQAPLSPRVRELGDLLGRVIAEYEKHHPAVTGSEVRMALQVAARQSKSAGAPAPVVLVGVGVALLLAGLVAFFMVERGAGVESLPMVTMAVGVFLIVGLLVLVRKLSGG